MCITTNYKCLNTISIHVYVYVYVLHLSDVEWWLASRDLVQSELDEKPRKSPKKNLKTTTSNVKRRSVLDSDEEDEF
jgi:hypothetical protein